MKPTFFFEGNVRFFNVGTYWESLQTREFKKRHFIFCISTFCSKVHVLWEWQKVGLWSFCLWSLLWVTCTAPAQSGKEVLGGLSAADHKVQGPEAIYTVWRLSSRPAAFEIDKPELCLPHKMGCSKTTVKSCINKAKHKGNTHSSRPWPCFMFLDFLSSLPLFLLPCLHPAPLTRIPVH